jgi:hypothetical protein
MEHLRFPTIIDEVMELPAHVTWKFLHCDKLVQCSLSHSGRGPHWNDNRTLSLEFCEKLKIYYFSVTWNPYQLRFLIDWGNFEIHQINFYFKLKFKINFRYQLQWRATTLMDYFIWLVMSLGGARSCRFEVKYNLQLLG